MKRLKKKAALSPEQYISDYPSGYEHVNNGITLVNINDIIGMSIGRRDEYDNNMQPIGEPDDRWKRLYNRAKQEGNLNFAGPIHLVKVPDEDKYFIYDDGNHRLSVAKALHFDSIEAEITVLVPKGSNEEIDKEMEETQQKIREYTKQLDGMKVEQEKVWDSNDLDFNSKDKKFDEIEKQKEPLYKIVDDLWAKIDDLKKRLIE